MAFCPRDDRGYATPLALVVSLALAAVATAMVARSAMLLRLARTDLQQRVAEEALAGAQLEAAATIVRSGAGAAFHWTLGGEGQWVDIVAESEREKLSLAAASQLDDARLRALGAADPSAVRAAIAAAGAGADVVDLGDTPLWADCAPRVISPVGQRAQDLDFDYQEPDASQDQAAWRVGELWRVRATSAAGWRDDRIVRFTGDARHPVAVVRRRLSRSHGGQDRCDAVLAAFQ